MTLSLRRAEAVAEDAPLLGMIGEHPLMKEVYRLVRRVAPTDLPVLIVGETGTGKELVARAVHELSGRAGLFVAFNVCAMAETMVEDALFGHVRGAFTGALAEAPGYLAEADRGTAFFDEIGAMGLSVQAKLLRAIETGEFRPVGGRADRRSKFRPVAATNADLRELVRDGRFRRDLFERIHGLVIALPPLPERAQDITLLATSFLAELDHGGLKFADDALAALVTYSWPGNVRELRNTARRAAIARRGGVIDVEVMRAALQQPGERWLPDTPRQSYSPATLERLLREHNWDTAAAARALGIGRSTFYEWLGKAGLKAPRFRNSG